jgi:hypothetical protein
LSISQVSSDLAATGVALAPSMSVPDEVRAAAERLGVGQYLDDVVTFTIEIFGSFLGVQAELDPEVPDWEHIIFDVPVTGSPEEISDKQTSWCHRLVATIPNAPPVYTIVMSYRE